MLVMMPRDILDKQKKGQDPDRQSLALRRRSERQHSSDLLVIPEVV